MYPPDEMTLDLAKKYSAAMTQILDILQETTDGSSDALALLVDTMRAFAVLFAKEGHAQEGVEILAERLRQKLPEEILGMTGMLGTMGNVAPPAKEVN